MRQPGPHPHNECTACGEDFSSISLFDRHRVGKHEYTFDYTDEATWDGRRCLGSEEMREKGWTFDKRGRWTDPVAAMKVRETFATRT